MKLSNPKQVINFDDFLPLDGESRFEMLYTNGALNLEIFYEGDGVTGEVRRTICFLHAKYFFKTPFPGYSFFSCAGDRDISLLNSLVEYEYSDMLAMEVGASDGEKYKHYRLFLHSTGVAIHVIARSCEMLDDILSD